jgi:hypothetical protein
MNEEDKIQFEAYKEELKLETERFKTFVLLVVANTTGCLGLILRSDFIDNILV